MMNAVAPSTEDGLTELRRPRVIRFSARIAAWGIAVGAAVPLLSAFGLGSDVLWQPGGAGMVVGGLGAMGLGGALCAEKRARRVWRAAGLALVPFGVSSVVLGASTLLGRWGLRLAWSWFPGGLTGASLAFLVIGLVLSVLFGMDLVRLMVRTIRGGDSEEAPQL